MRSTATRILVLGEFSSAHHSLQALSGLREKGFVDLELYSPYPVPEAIPLLKIKRSPMSAVMLIGGTLGLITAYSMQWFCNAYDYPINIGGKPLNSWPAFIPICFELTVLFSALAGFFGLWLFLRLPRLHHPVFEAAHFGSSTNNGFWVSVEAPEAELEVARVKQALEGLGANRVEAVRQGPEDQE